ncbi:hypothetical protein CCR75_006701 [Bremia lactucae]|uniref:Uncharacterized protein n=1 Tax=Bremia lactucae TaxID=4779 RepID=A0A976FET8_BRELC|nr:hypothetical protein CCR75_006701 [Bremia lactucae]
MLKIKVLSKKVFNRDSYGGAVKSFTLKVLPSLTGDEIDIRPFMKWFKKIKGHLPGNPELAYATTAVLLSEKLSKWDAARVWAKFSVEDVKSSGLLKKVLFKVWGSQKIGFEELLSTVTWNENYGLAISTFAAPAFGMIYEFMTQQTKNEMLVFNSFVDLFKARFPNGNIKSLIHEGRRVIKRKINLSQTYYLDVFVEFLTRNVIYDDASLIFHDISLLSSYDVIQTASSQLRTLLVGVTDVSRFADQLVNELFSQKKDVELFLVMHVRIFGKKYPDFKSAVFKLLSTKWVNQHDVPARTVKLFKKMQLHKAPIDANMSTRRTLRFIIWINFIYLANNYNGLGSKTICEEILRHADHIATTDVLLEAFSYAQQLLSKPIDFS